MNSAEQDISDTLKAYERALNMSNTDAVMAVYAPDGVFMPQELPTFVGADAVRKSYDMIFRRITLTVTFTVVEVHVVSDSWAFARTTSAGKQKINATGETTDEANHELFVFEKPGGSWKIARYCFSTERDV